MKMLKEVQDSKTLIVNGPASATLITGRVSVLGKEMDEGEKIVIRRGKALPFESEEESALDIVLGVDAECYELEGSSIPDSWRKAVKEALSPQKLCIVMVLGDVDSGKTSFSTFLINKALKSEFKPAIVDVDLGQSDIGPPTSIGLSLISKPVADLFSVKPASVFFTGRTSPQGMFHRVYSGLKSILEQISREEVDLIVINTDGWIDGEAAQTYKERLIRGASPNILAGIQRNGELEPILTPMEGEFKVLRLNSPQAVRRRSREDRRALREQSYKKYLGKPVVRNLNLSWVKLEYTALGLGVVIDRKRIEPLEKALGISILYCEESSRDLFVVLHRGVKVDEERVLAAEKSLQKNVYIVREGEERGLLVGLLDDDRRFLGLGIISKIDYRNRVLKLRTSCKEDISIVQFGQLMVDESGNEQRIVTSFSARDGAPVQG